MTYIKKVQEKDITSTLRKKLYHINEVVSLQKIMDYLYKV